MTNTSTITQGGALALLAPFALVAFGLYCLWLLAQLDEWPATDSASLETMHG